MYKKRKCDRNDKFNLLVVTGSHMWCVHVKIFKKLMSEGICWNLINSFQLSGCVASKIFITEGKSVNNASQLNG